MMGLKMKYHRLLSGTQLVAKYFTTEARHYYTSKIDWQSQRQILWEAVTPYDVQPTPEEIVTLEDVKIAFNEKLEFVH